MTQPNHRELREMLGAYSLGHLAPEEERLVRSHLAQCAECRAELEEVRPAAEALGMLKRRPPVAAAAPPPELESRIATSLAEERALHERRRRSHRLLVAAAAIPVALAIGGGGAFIGHELGSRDTVAAPAVPVEDVPVRTRGASLDASAGVVAHTWGVEIKLEAVGLERGASYSAVVVTEDGRRRSAGAFVGTGSRVMNCNLNSDVLRPDAAEFNVLDEDGRIVLEAEL